jgi:hypothetical protein
MGIFDDGSQQSIVDTARQQIDKPPAVFVEVLSAALPGNKDPIIAVPRRVLTRDTLSDISCAHAGPTKGFRARSTAKTAP